MKILEILKNHEQRSRNLEKDYFSMIFFPIIETIYFSIPFYFLYVKFFKMLIISSHTPKPCLLHTQWPTAPGELFIDTLIDDLRNLKRNNLTNLKINLKQRS